MPEATNEKITTPHLGKQTTALNLNVDISEIENENDNFHSGTKWTLVRLTPLLITTREVTYT